MRSDEQLDHSFRSSQRWKIDLFSGERLSEYVQQPDGSVRITSLSGHERNVLFLNDRGQRFFDISLVSGADNIADGRTFVIWDYDRDGWQDMALVNANSPLLSIYRNEIAQVADSGDGQMIALRFVGGNRTGRPTTDAACLDGYGAKVTVALDGQNLFREHRCGEGFAGQNSATMVIGIGIHTVAQSIDVRWPTGRTQHIENVSAGTQLTVYEDVERTADGSGFVRESYHPDESLEHSVADRQEDPPVMLPLANVIPANSSHLSLFTTMATWCDACKGQIPQLAALRASFDAKDLAMFGVPIDATDGMDELDTYSATYQPAYQLLADLSLSDRRAVNDLVRASTVVEALPSSVVTDTSGRVLKSFVGVPTVSEVRTLLHTLKDL